MTFAHSLTVNAILLIAFLTIVSHLRHKRCECEKRGTMLKPRWKRYDKRDRQ